MLKHFTPFVIILAVPCILWILMVPTMKYLKTDWIKRKQIREVWTMILYGSFLYALCEPTLYGGIMKLHGELSFWYGYGVAGLLGALIMCGCWYITGKAFPEDQNQPIELSDKQPDTSKEKVSKDISLDSGKAHQLKTQEVSQNVQTQTPDPNNQSTAIHMEKSQGDFEGNLIEGFQTGIYGNNSVISGKDNVIRREQNNTFPPPTGEFKQASNNDLNDYVKKLASQMRMFEREYEDKKSQNLQDKKTRDEEKDIFKKKYLPTAISLASEMISRSGGVNIPNTRETMSIKLGGKVLINGMLVGPYPVSAAADFLEYLAKGLQ